MLHKIPEFKHCPLCDKTLPSIDYSTDNSRLDGLKFCCKLCFKTYTPKKSKTNFDNINKECCKCHRTLEARQFGYSQHSSDHLTSDCRTCRLHKGKPPTLAQVEEFESTMKALYRAAVVELAAKYDTDFFLVTEKHRGELENVIYRKMQDQNLLKDWKPPIWMHKSSMKQ